MSQTIVSPANSTSYEERELLRNSVNMLNEQGERLKKQVKKNKRLEEEIRRMKEEMSEKDEELIRRSEDVRNTHEELMRVESELERKEDILEDANEKVKKKETVLTSMGEDIRTAHEELMKMERELQNKQDKIDKKVDDVEQMREEMEREKKIKEAAIQKGNFEIRKRDEELRMTRDDLLMEKEEVFRKVRELRSKDDEIEKMSEEVRRMKDEMEAMRRERANMKIEDGLDTWVAPPDWMRKEIEETRQSNATLTRNIVELYKAISKRALATQQSTVSSDIKRFIEEIQKLEHFCEKISKDVRKSNEERIKEISKKLKSLGPVVEATQTREVQRSIDQFLGEYTISEELKSRAGYTNVKIRKVSTGYSECLRQNQSEYMRIFVPDNVLREGIRSWIAGNSLNILQNGITTKYELCGRDLRLNGHLYTRV